MIIICISILSLSSQCRGDEQTAKNPAASAMPPATQPMKVNSSVNQTENESRRSPTSEFTDSGYTNYGNWHASTSVAPAIWQPGMTISVMSIFKMTDSHLLGLAAANNIKMVSINP